MGCMGLSAAAAAACAWLGDALRFLLFLDLEDAARSAWKGVMTLRMDKGEVGNEVYMYSVIPFGYLGTGMPL